MLDVDRLAGAMLEGAQALIAKTTAPIIEANEELRQANADLSAVNEVLTQRIATLEARSEREPRADPAETAATVRAMIEAAVSEAVGAEADKRDTTIRAAVDEAVSEAVAKADAEVSGRVAALEKWSATVSGWQDEARGAIVAAGEATEKRLKAAEDRLSAVEATDLTGFASQADVKALSDRVTAIPEPRNYAPEIAEVRALVDAIEIPEAMPGKDGISISEVKQNDDGELIVKLTNGETLNAGKVRGADGFGFDDLTIEHDGERTFTLVWSKGERVERKTVEIPVVLDRGIWKEGAYRKGDGVILGGSYWIAQIDTDKRPETSKDWRLSVKRGRDGRDGRHVDTSQKSQPVKIGEAK